jgi:uncharacterized delta-60 repeat protein
VAVDANGKIVACGELGTSMLIARYTANGTPDTSFGVGGATTASWADRPYVKACAVAAGNKVVVLSAADSASSRVWLLVRFNANGTLDTSYDSDGYATINFGAATDSTPADLKIAADGKIVAGGTVGANFVVARQLSTGALDTSFGWFGVTYADLGAWDLLNGLALDGSGRIVGVGSTGSAVDPPLMAAVRFTSAGAYDTSFSGDGVTVFGVPGYTSVSATAVAAAAGDKIVLAGNGNGASASSLITARLSADGSMDHTYSGDGLQLSTPGGAVNVTGVALATDGKVVVSGSIFGPSSGELGVWRFTSNGQPDVSFDGDGLATTAYSTPFQGGSLALDAASQPIVAGRLSLF